jgi:8-oxo-dGTP diphosphatase
VSTLSHVDANEHAQPLHSVSVAGVILDDTDENVLLIQRRDNLRWEPPGGVLELNETVEAGLLREIYEETGVQVDVHQLTGVYKNMSRGIVALVYRCSTRGEPATSTPEAVMVRWQPLARIDELLVPAFAVRVYDASNCVGARTRAHDGIQLITSPADKSESSGC